MCFRSLMKIMVGCTQKNKFVWVVQVLLFSIACFRTTASTCSWGAWSPWDCTCCGNSIEKPVFSVRTQCCAGTSPCSELHIAAKTITSIGIGFLQSGSCFNNCHEEFSDNNSNKCSSVEPTVNQTLLLATPALCHSVCIGNIVSLFNFASV